MAKVKDGRRNNRPSKVGTGGHRERSEELDFKNDSRRQILVRLRMTHPPLSIRQIADRLKCSVNTVMADIRFLRTQFSSEYFADNNRAAVARACAELQALAAQFLTEAENMPKGPMWTTERSSLYGRALQALDQRNNIMMECGIMSKAAVKIETSGPDGQPIAYDVTTMSIQERIKSLSLIVNPADTKPEGE
jgi:hypothetical protein